MVNIKPSPFSSEKKKKFYFISKKLFITHTPHNFVPKKTKTKKKTTTLKWAKAKPLL
jgi:hypothetical protein